MAGGAKAGLKFTKPGFASTAAENRFLFRGEPIPRLLWLLKLPGRFISQRGAHAERPGPALRERPRIDSRMDPGTGHSLFRLRQAEGHSTGGSGIKPGLA